MKRAVLAVVAIITSVLIGAVGMYAYDLYQGDGNKTVAQIQPTPEPPTVAELLRLVNEERAKVGVAPLVINLDIQKSAQLKADDMSNNNYFGHIMPSTGKVLNSEMESLYMANCVDGGENLTDNLYDRDNTPQQAVTNWINSKPHYEAMVDPKFDSTGFGIAGTKIVQHFCDAR